MPSLSDFVKLAPRLYVGNLQDLDNEWRNLDTTPDLAHLLSDGCESHDFYMKLGELKDNEGTKQFDNFSQFAL